MTVTYRLLLTADGLDDVELPFSSISYSISNAPTANISATIEGEEYSSAISARANGDLEFYYKTTTDDDYVLLAYGAIAKITINETQRRYYITLEGIEESYPLFTADGNIGMDDIASMYTLENGVVEFVTPIVGQYYIPGAVVEYDSIEYGIGSVSYSKSVNGAGSWTLTEGDVEVTATEGTASACSFELESGVQVSDRMVWSEGGGFGEYDSCYKIDDQLGGLPVGCRMSMIFGMYPAAAGQIVYVRFYHFDLAAESDTTFEITAAEFTDMATYEFDAGSTEYWPPGTYHVCNGEMLSIGFVAVLSLGESNYGDGLKTIGSAAHGSYTNSVDNPFLTEITRFYANEEKALALPAGSYTLTLIYINEYYGGAINGGAGIDYTIDYEATVV